MLFKFIVNPSVAFISALIWTGLNINWAGNSVTYSNGQTFIPDALGLTSDALTLTPGNGDGLGYFMTIVRKKRLFTLNLKFDLFFAFLANLTFFGLLSEKMTFFALFGSCLPLNGF